MENLDEKRSQIVEAAIKRFSHFGIQKTTMSEIADDIKISKANLYYYYPDKWSLVEAIVELLQGESDGQITKILTSGAGVEIMLSSVMDIKQEFFKKYQLLIQNLNQVNIQDLQFRELADRIYENERSVTAQILEIGINSGELETIDVYATSNLYTSVMRGLGLYCYFANPSPVMDMNMLEAIRNQQRHFVRIFINGITKKKSEQ